MLDQPLSEDSAGVRGTSWVCCCISLALRWSSCSPTAMPTPGGACARDPLHDPRGLRREKAVREPEPPGAACSPCPRRSSPSAVGSRPPPTRPPSSAPARAERGPPCGTGGGSGAGRGWTRPPAAARSDAGAAGRNSGFLRGHSCHSSAGPPRPAACSGCSGNPVPWHLSRPLLLLARRAGSSSPPRPRAVTRSLVAAAVLFQGPRSSAVCAGQRGARRLPWGSSWEGGTGGCLNAGSPRVKASPSLCLRPSLCSLRAD